MAPFSQFLSRATRRFRAFAIGATAAMVLTACGGGGTTSDQVSGAAPAAASSTGLRPLPIAFTSRKAVSYSPYRTSTSDAGRASEVITDAQVKQDLDLLVEVR